MGLTVPELVAKVSAAGAGAGAGTEQTAAPAPSPPPSPSPSKSKACCEGSYPRPCVCTGSYYPDVGAYCCKGTASGATQEVCDASYMPRCAKPDKTWRRRSSPAMVTFGNCKGQSTPCTAE